MSAPPVRVPAWALAVLAVLASAAFTGVGAVGVLYAQGARTVCATEDSPSCVWIGPVQGNRHGPIIVNGPEK